MHLIRLLPLVLLLSIGVFAGSALADSQVDPIVIIEIGDPLDQRMIEYIVGAISSEDAHLYVLKIDSPGTSSGDLAALYQAVMDAPAPVVSWIGPHPAVAFGGSAYLANHADIRSAAPGTRVGYLTPAVQRGEKETPSVREGDDPEAFFTSEELLADMAVTISPEGPPLPGFVDRIDPALGQLLVSLDGVVVTRGAETWELSTSRAAIISGQEVLVVARGIVFKEPGLVDKFLRLGARPETAFLFLLLALTFGIFEFFAAGRGLMAAVASLSFLPAAYGLATLPMWWPAVTILAAGMAFLVWGFSQNRADWRGVVGTVLLLIAGFTFTTSGPAYPPAPWMVVLAVGGSVGFIWYSLTTVVWGRFATPTVGRENLLGKKCLAVSTLDPVGVVILDGARWRATADHGVEIGPGAAVEIVGVTGLVLEVDPVTRPRRKEISKNG